MNGYLLSIIGTVLLCSIITVIIPSGKTAGTVKGIAKLVCVLAIIAPILRFFKTGELDWTKSDGDKENFSKTVIEIDQSFIQYYSESRVRETERQMETLLEEEFNIETAVSLRWEFESETVASRYEWERIRIKQIYVKMPENLSANAWNDVQEPPRYNSFSSNILALHSVRLPFLLQAGLRGLC